MIYKTFSVGLTMHIPAWFVKRHAHLEQSLVLAGQRDTTMVQLKGNLIPACVLQVENSWVMITSCVQYLNGHLLFLCPHQANRRVCAPANITLILNEHFNETLILIVYTWWTYEYCLCTFQSILESNALLKSCLWAVACSISCPTVWREEWIWHR